MVYLKSVENVITLGKLIGLLFLFCLPLLSILFLKTKRNDLARPVMGTIFLVTYTYYTLTHVISLIYVVGMSESSMSVVCQINCVKPGDWWLAVKPVTPVLFISYTLEL